ncbi:MAG: hypothetical protein U5N86_05060 [Planctomycetota bacterium]|nr:hypothetical protein [Planctomycetota bacterium]
MLEGFFGIDNVLARLEKKGYFLAKLNGVVDWEDFRPILHRIRKAERKTDANSRIIRQLTVK